MPSRRPVMGTPRACTRLGVVSALEEAVWTAGLALRDTEFGAILRGARVQPSSPNSFQSTHGWPHPQTLMDWELSFDPAVHRTIAAVTSMRVLGEEIPQEGRSWVEWSQKALHTLQRIAAKCSAGIPGDVRRGLLDVDDLLPMQTHMYVTELRQDESGRLALRFAGLDAPMVRDTLAEVYRQVLQTPTFRRARDAAEILQNRPSLLTRFTSRRPRILREIRAARPGETGGQVETRGLAVIKSAYDDEPDLRDSVSSLRAHNQLVHRVVWALLGLAEQFEPVRIVETLGAVVDDAVERERVISVTVVDPRTAFLRASHPVRMELSCPLDGVYIVRRHTSAWAGSIEDDLGLVSLEPVMV